jgi:FkbM family methyltransferase
MQNILKTLEADPAAPFGVIVHLGAGLCREMDHYRQLGPEQVLLVEADPQLAGRLRLAVQGEAHVSVVQAAITDQDGPCPFYLTNNGRDSSVLRPTGLLDWYPNLTVSATAGVPGQTLAHLLAQADIDGDGQNLLVLELQGNEAPVLAVTPAELVQKFAWVAVRACQPEVYEGAATGLVLHDLLHGRGFVPVAIDQAGGASPFQEILFRRDADLIAKQELAEKVTQLMAEKAVLAADCAAKAKQATDTQAQVAQLSTARDDQARLATERQAQIATLSQERDQQAKLAADRQAQIEALHKEKAALAADCAAKAKQATDTQARIATLTEQVEHQARQITDTQAQVAQLSTARDDQARLATERQAQIATLSQERDQQAKLAADRQAQIEALHKEKAALAADCAAKAKQATDTQAKVDQLSQSRDQQAKLASDLKQQLAQAQQSLQEKDKRLADLQAHVNEAAQRQRLLDEEMLRAEAQIDLIKDVLLREPGI